MLSSIVSLKCARSAKLFPAYPTQHAMQQNTESFLNLALRPCHTAVAQHVDTRLADAVVLRSSSQAGRVPRSLAIREHELEAAGRHRHHPLPGKAVAAFLKAQPWLLRPLCTQQLPQQWWMPAAVGTTRRSTLEHQHGEKPALIQAHAGQSKLLSARISPANRMRMAPCTSIGRERTFAIQGVVQEDLLPARLVCQRDDWCDGGPSLRDCRWLLCCGLSSTLERPRPAVRLTAGTRGSLAGMQLELLLCMTRWQVAYVEHVGHQT